MTQEEKYLLLKDLCARLPYKVKVLYLKDFDRKWYDLKVVDLEEDYAYIESNDTAYTNVYAKIEDIKPYLFPLSSMTEKQKKEFIECAGYEERDEDCVRHKETYYYDMVGHEDNMYPNSDAIDWLNKNHFDYRGLIPMGLAIDATELNIY